MHRILIGVLVVALLGGCVHRARMPGIGFAEIEVPANVFAPAPDRTEPAEFFWPAGEIPESLPGEGEAPTRAAAELIRHMVPGVEGAGRLYAERDGVRFEGPQGAVEAIGRLREAIVASKDDVWRVQVEIARIPARELTGFAYVHPNEGAGALAVISARDAARLLAGQPRRRLDGVCGSAPQLALWPGQVGSWCVERQYAHVAGYVWSPAGSTRALDPEIGTMSVGVGGRVQLVPNGPPESGVALWSEVELLGPDPWNGEARAQPVVWMKVKTRQGTFPVTQEIPVATRLDAGGLAVVPADGAVVWLMPDPAEAGWLIVVCLRPVPVAE